MVQLQTLKFILVCNEALFRKHLFVCLSSTKQFTLQKVSGEIYVIKYHIPVASNNMVTMGTT
jgi:hypothetical protein